ncbi:NAD(P)/FAD-dependent oxidoreductase [candidate division KSB1 bacterium]|nr:NAD(P)/FAD-dependent oxidoreductase [candidate division KSB1 bacterium]
MRSRYDIVVVGGGPAGSSAARSAAMRGKSVLILEKDRDIGIPVRCAEAVGEIGLKRFLDPKPEWISNKVNFARLIAPDGTAVEVSHHVGGYILNRKVFDFDLAQMAAQHGANIMTKTHVYDLKRDADGKINGVKYLYLGKPCEVESRIVIAADGVESRLSRLAGIDTVLRLQDIETCVQMTVANVRLDRQYCDFYFSSRLAPGGYVWVFPKNDHLANIGLGISGEHNAPRAAIDYLKEFIQSHYPDASILTTVAGGVPCAPYMDRMVTDHFMVVGDAAHQANPMTGGGIVLAIWAGQICGEVAADAIDGNDTSQKRLRQYEKLWYDAGGKVHIRSYRLKEAVYRLTDDELNRTAHKINKLAPENRTLVSIFKTALLHNPKLISDIIKVFLS